MTSQPEIRQGHPYFMYDAILSQPEAMAEMLAQHSATTREVAAMLATKRRLYIVGIGTSWHAVLVAEHWFRHFAGAARGLCAGGAGLAFLRVLRLPACSGPG